MRKAHILVIRFSALGDVAMVVPVVHSVAVKYPDVRITVLSRAFARPLFEHLAPNVSFMEADLKQEYHGVKGLNALFRRLSAKHFTHVADLHAVLRSDYLRMRFNIANYRVEHVDKHRQQRRLLVSQKKRALQQLPTSIENYADVFCRLGFPIDLQASSLPLWKGEGSPYQEGGFGIAPFAAHEGKVYPPQLMEQVIELLVQRHPQKRIYLFGRGQQESTFFTQWCERWEQCTNASSLCENLSQELELMSRIDVMLSMDSANMHLASLTGTPVVSVWGATHPYAGFTGWRQRKENIVQVEGLDCRPCSIYGQKPCLRGDMACMNMIKPETIVARIEDNLSINPKTTKEQ